MFTINAVRWKRNRKIFYHVHISCIRWRCFVRNFIHKINPNDVMTVAISQTKTFQVSSFVCNATLSSKLPRTESAFFLSSNILQKISINVFLGKNAVGAKCKARRAEFFGFFIVIERKHFFLWEESLLVLSSDRCVITRSIHESQACSLKCCLLAVNRAESSRFSSSYYFMTPGSVATASRGHENKSIITPVM